MTKIGELSDAVWRALRTRTLEPINRVLRATYEAAYVFWRQPRVGPAQLYNSESRHPLAVNDATNWRLASLVAILLALLAAVASYGRASALSPVILYKFGYGVDKQSGPTTIDILFDADLHKRFELMTNKFGGLEPRSFTHPLLSLFMCPPFKVLRALGFDQFRAVWTTMALIAGIWSVLLFSLLTLWGCRIIDAAVFTILGQISSSFMFWTSVPETFAFGSATIIAALIATLWPKGVNALVRYTAAIAVSFAMTSTNVMVGLIASARRLRYSDIWIAGTSAWFIVSMLWGLQKVIAPESTYFFPPSGSWISTYLPSFTLGRIGWVLQALFSHSMVMPQIEMIPGSDLHPTLSASADRVMSVQRSFIGSGSVAGAIASIVWFGLVGFGTWAAWAGRSGLSCLCLLVLGGQTMLHLVFGPETFLYTLHVVPLLIVLAAGVTFTRFRPVGLALAGIVIVLGGVNNWGQFNGAAAIVQELDVHARTFQGR